MSLPEKLLANSIRMYTLYHTALELCSVQRLDDLVHMLLPRCITAMDVRTACLVSREHRFDTLGHPLVEPDRQFLETSLSRDGDLHRILRLPSGKQAIACPIEHEQRLMGMLIAVDKEGSDFVPEDTERMTNLARITATALANVYEYEELLQRTEDLEEDIRQREARELEMLRRELADARMTQLSLLPRRVPDLPGLDIHGICQPALDVGGDFYDYLALEGETLAIVLADVVGHGMRGAMYAVLSYGVLHAEAKLGVTPSQMLWCLNEDLQVRCPARVHCAMSIGMLRLGQPTLLVSNAGIPYPIVRRGRDVFELENNGMPLGAWRGYPYEDTVFDLEVGDIVVFLSDGFGESISANDPSCTYMESDRIRPLLARLPADVSASRIATEIIADVERFTGGQQAADDRTVVAVKVRAPFWEMTSPHLESISGI